MARVEVNWACGEWSLCIGEWDKFNIDGKSYLKFIPEHLRESDMNTYGTYSRWYFGGVSGWEEEWEQYEDGLECPEWITENDYWLSKITDDYKLKEEIFAAFQAQDFRRGSCGGCI